MNKYIKSICLVVALFINVSESFSQTEKVQELAELAIKRLFAKTAQPFEIEENIKVTVIKSKFKRDTYTIDVRVDWQYKREHYPKNTCYLEGIIKVNSDGCECEWKCTDRSKYPNSPGGGSYRSSSRVDLKCIK